MEVTGLPDERVPIWRRAARWGMLLGALALAFSLAAWFVVSPLFWYRSLPVAIPFAAGLLLLALGIAVNFQWLLASLRLRKTRIAVNVVATMLLMIAVVVLINLILSRHYARLDLTQKGLFTLSQQSLDLLAALRKDVTVTELASAEPAVEIGWTRDAARDLLNEYCARSPRVHFGSIDFDRDQTRVIELKTRIKTEVERDSFVFECGNEVRTVMALELLIVPKQADDPLRFRGEQVLTETLKAVSMDKKRVICFTMGHGEKDIKGADDVTGFSLLAQALERENYSLQTLNLALVKRVPADCSVLVVAGPQTPFSPEEFQAVQDYLGNNGSLFAMFDSRYLQGQSVGWNDALQPYGISVRDDVLDQRLDPSVGQAAPSQAIYPESYATHRVTRNLPTLTPAFPAACALEVKRPRPPAEGVPFYLPTPLIRSSQNTWGEATMDDAARRNRFDEDKDMRGPITIAASAQAFEPSASPNEPPKEAEGARIVVIANSFFAANSAFGRRPGNQLLVFNAVSWLDPKGLPPSTIPARGLDVRPLHKWTPGIARAVLLISVVAMPLLVIMFGGLVWFIRRK